MGFKRRISEDRASRRQHQKEHPLLQRSRKQQASPDQEVRNVSRNWRFCPNMFRLICHWTRKTRVNFSRARYCRSTWIKRTYEIIRYPLRPAWPVHTLGGTKYRPSFYDCNQRTRYRKLSLLFWKTLLYYLKPHPNRKNETCLSCQRNGTTYIQRPSWAWTANWSYSTFDRAINIQKRSTSKQVCWLIFFSLDWISSKFIN